MAEPQTPSTATPASAKFPASVNSQITDSIAQANTKVLGDAPAMAMGNLYMATSQALSNAAHNATNAQQQSYVTMQAATTQGVATLLSIDTATTGVATQNILTTMPPDALGKQVDSSVADVQAALPPTTTSFAAVPPAQSNSDAVLQQHKEFADAVHTTMEVFATSLDRMNQTLYMQLLDTIRLAATNACLAAIIKSPEKTEEYQRILEMIKELE